MGLFVLSVIQKTYIYPCHKEPKSSISIPLIDYRYKKYGKDETFSTIRLRLDFYEESRYLQASRSLNVYMDVVGGYHADPGS